MSVCAIVHIRTAFKVGRGIPDDARPPSGQSGRYVFRILAHDKMVDGDRATAAH